MTFLYSTEIQSSALAAVAAFQLRQHGTRKPQHLPPLSKGGIFLDISDDVKGGGHLRHTTVPDEGGQRESSVLTVSVLSPAHM